MNKPIEAHKAKGLISFADVEVDWSSEYCKARALMGLKGTDLDRLLSNVSLFYLNCPIPEFVEAFLSLMGEIQTRKTFIETGLVVPCRFNR